MIKLTSGSNLITMIECYSIYVYIYIYIFTQKGNMYLSRTNVSFLLKKYTINLMNHITIIFYSYFTIGIIQKLPQYKQ